MTRDIITDLADWFRHRPESADDETLDTVAQSALHSTHDKTPDEFPVERASTGPDRAAGGTPGRQQGRGRGDGGAAAREEGEAVMTSTWCVLSRKVGNKKWYRHIPGFSTRAHAEQAVERWGKPGVEYDIAEYECGPAPTYPNGQRRGYRRAQGRPR